MKIKHITYPERDAWNHFVASFSSSPVLQSFEWGELKARFGWQPLRIAVEDGGRLIAGISILKRKVPYIGNSLFYAPRGPVMNLYNRELLEFLLDAVEIEADKYRAISLKMDPEVPDMPEEQSEVVENLNKLGFVRAIKQVQPRATYLLDLTPDANDILMGFEEKTRYNIRLAEKKGVVVREEAGEKGVETFYRMYRQTAQRDQFLIHPLSYYQAVREILFQRGLGTIFTAYFNNKPIACVVVFCFGSRVWYMYGASLAEHRNVMPNHLLHWHVINWAKEKNYKIYDLWGIPVDPKEGHPLWGVYRFKKGFQGKTVKFIGAYDFPYSPLFYNLFEYGLLGWKNIRSLITKGRIEDSLGE